MSLYLWINILSLAGLLLLSFNKKAHFFTHWKTLIPSILIIGSIFIAWDIYFTDIGIWGFNVEHLSGITFFNLPIEECLFFFTIPSAFVFILETVKAYFPRFRPIHFSYIFSLLLTVVAVVLAIFFKENTYTFITLLSVGVLNWVVYFGFTPRWYPYFIVAFLIALIPCLIVNGILMGITTEIPTVWYNENEIIGFYLFSIPIENIFYTFLMLFSVVIVHEYLAN